MKKIAAIQMCSTNQVEENLSNVELLIKEASDKGALLAVLPEMFVMFGENAQDKVLIKEVHGSGIIQNKISEIARKYKIWIVAGTMPIESSNPQKIRAASIVFDCLGNQIARYDKIHLFDVKISDKEIYRESDTTEPGNEIIVIDSPIGKLGICVCFDLRFPEVFEKLSNKGVEVIVVPSAFTVKTGEAHWKLLCRSRAIDTFSYVIGACQGGTHSNGRITYGHSLIVNPWGKIEQECQQEGNGIIFCDIDLENLYQVRMQIPTGKMVISY